MMTLPSPGRSQTRAVDVRDRSVKVTKKQHLKVSNDNEIGAPLQGKLVGLKVKEGDTVEVGSLLGEVNQEKSASFTQVRPKQKNKEPITKKLDLDKYDEEFLADDF